MIRKIGLFSFIFTTIAIVSCKQKASSPTNLEIVRSTYEGETPEIRGENLATYLAPDAVWVEANGFTYAGSYTGIDEIKQNVFGRLATEWTDYKFVPEDYVSEKDHVIAVGTYSGTYNKTGKYFEARVAHIWKLSDGKIIHFEQIVDSAPVVEATK